MQNVSESKYFKMTRLKLDMSSKRCSYEFKYLQSVGYRTVLVEITENVEDSSKVFFTGRNCALVVEKK